MRYIYRLAQWMTMACIGVSLTACETISGPKITKFKEPSKKEKRIDASRTKTQLAIEYMNMHDYRAGVRTIEEALKDDENYDLAWLTRAQIYQFLKVYDKAETSFKRALSISPNGAEINNNYGWFICSSLNHPAESIAYFDKALADPTYPAPEISYMNKGICLSKSGQYKMADAYFERALQANPEFIPVHKERARLALTQQDIKRADREFRLYQSRIAQLGADDLLLGWKISRENGEMQAASEYELQLRTNFPYSDELKSITGHFEE